MPIKPRQIMIYTHSKYSLSILGCLLLFACKESTIKQQEPVTVFAATSLSITLSELLNKYSETDSTPLRTNFASSGTLARQIEQGATPHIYISANTHWGNYLDSLGFIDHSFSTNYIQNELVLITSTNNSIESIVVDSTFDFPHLIEKQKLSIGNPTHVPVGSYAKQALEYYNWYEDVQQNIVPAKDARTALMRVEMQEALYGIVYKTDALQSTKVKILATFPSQSHTPIQYFIGICKNTKHSKELYSYLFSKLALQLYSKQGYRIDSL